jgi:hypothetical protein
MRIALALVACLATPALAQPGVWTGYVGGWKYDPPQQVLPLRVFTQGSLPRERTASERERARAAIARVPLVVPVASYFPSDWGGDTQLAAQREELQREQEALAQEQARMQAELADRERRLAEEQAAAQRALLAQQQRLAEQQRVAREQAAQSEALAERERAAASERQAAEEERLRQEQTTERATQARAEPKAASPEIHHWVDADGVEHYSTRPPPGR